MNTLAIDVGGTKLSMAVFSGDAMIRRTTLPTERAGGREWMVEQIRRFASEWKRDPGYQRCAIGFGGPVLWESQTVALSTHVGGWSGFDLPGALRDVTGTTPLIDNDANVGALGEGIYGAGKKQRPLFYMTLSTGIGGGILTEHGVYRGADSYAGEIGHLTIQPDGPECLCGARGCFERVCCGLWLERDYGRSAKELLSDPAFVREYVVNLARGLKSAVMLLNPAVLIIGGGIAKAGDALFVPLREELSRQMTSWSRARVRVDPAALGDDSVLYGCLALVS